MPNFPSFFNYIFILQFALIFFWFVVTIVVIIAVWRAMKAHESIARSMRILTQGMKTNAPNESSEPRPNAR